MRSLVAMELTPALELVVLPAEVPRSITRRLHLDHLQEAAFILVTPFVRHAAITIILLTIVAGLLRPSTS